MVVIVIILRIRKIPGGQVSKLRLSARQFDFETGRGGTMNATIVGPFVPFLAILLSESSYG
jgi:hypothetical protein